MGPNLNNGQNTQQAVGNILNLTLKSTPGLKTHGVFWNIHGSGSTDLRPLFNIQTQQLSEDAPDLIDLESAIRFLREDDRMCIEAYEDKDPFNLTEYWRPVAANICT